MKNSLLVLKVDASVTKFIWFLLIWIWFQKIFLECFKLVWQRFLHVSWKAFQISVVWQLSEVASHSSPTASILYGGCVEYPPTASLWLEVSERFLSSKLFLLPLSLLLVYWSCAWYRSRFCFSTQSNQHSRYSFLTLWESIIRTWSAFITFQTSCS